MPFRRSSKPPSAPAHTPAHVSVSPPTFATAPAVSLGQTIKEGFGLGIGSAIAHRVVGAVLGPPKIEMAPVVAATKDPQSHDVWTRCLEQTHYDTEKCAPFKPEGK